ncbi:hypothetical protein PIB30_081286 [Stylosanthes scabra]|uniref:Uncharacterized protein n=1 Tax=Stylosanthes scabra TaxID=79078 RepID=A0ABU6URQ0_9FABA|nr:hypothetical protein [Stylosanthes scabra]
MMCSMIKGYSSSSSLKPTSEMIFILLACDSKSCWLNSFRKQCSSKTVTGAEDEAIRVDESRLPTPNLNDFLSPSNVEFEIWRKKVSKARAVLVSAGHGQGYRRGYAWGKGLWMCKCKCVRVWKWFECVSAEVSLKCVGKAWASRVGRLGMEVARLGVVLYGELGGLGRRPTPRRLVGRLGVECMGLG